MTRYKIDDMLKDYQEFHSEFQIKHFIIGIQGDTWAQYKQCLREVRARIESLKSDKIQLRILQSKKNKKKTFWPKWLNRRKIDISKNSNVTGTGIESLEDTIKGRERELNCFVKIAGKLKEQIGEVTDERRQQLELESWTAKGRRMVKIDQILTGRISHQTFEFVLSLPVQSQQIILEGIFPDRLMLDDLHKTTNSIIKD